MRKIVKKDFYKRKTLKVARDLLGCFLIRRLDAPRGGVKITRYRIVETEGYNGPEDKASHAHRGLTPRNKVMFGPPGIIYVYFTYGMHFMFNIVTEQEGYPAAVLIRALEPTSEGDIGACLPARAGGRRQECRTNGPARLTKALGIDKRFNGLSIFTREHGLWIEERDSKKIGRVIKTTRVGVDNSEEYRDKKWRFYLANSKWVSRR